MSRAFFLFFCTVITMISPAILFAQEFEVYQGEKLATILYDQNGSSLDSISAFLLAEDIKKVSGKMPLVTANKKEVKGNVIVIGEVGSELISSFLKKKGFPKNFAQRKESYLHKIISNPSLGLAKIFIISGTDSRGTAYGVFRLSKKIGVSPWYWWADVPVEKKKEISLDVPDFYSKEPSVEYRGIFLNDEDWGLQPWAAKNFETETGDIGPKTYSKIFELLLRLKANTIWPAMHPSTRAFFHYPGNPEMASKYHIVVGSSHAEPMLRNNVDEWDHDKMGAFSYTSNSENVYNYWEERVKESSNLDAIYTVGMRGIHDSGMEGVGSTEEAASVLSGIIQDQRSLIENYRKEPVSEIPQAFTVYKEVLGLYDSGMQIPEDVTIIWTDDNYGYIRRLSNEEERERKGGGGVYYHASYWGRPHDYLWLSSTHPGLIREEMIKAYETGNKKIWILNVGDIKPAEYNIQFFMDMAYDTLKFQDPEYIYQHLQSFYSSVFGKSYGQQLADLKMDYYQLAFQRKPEFMGWSQTEPTTPIDTTAYSPFLAGNEISSRIDQYEKLEKQSEKIRQELPSEYKDAYFQLIHYPVKGASFMNQKFLYRDLAIKYHKQNRLSAKNYQALSWKYYDSIKRITKAYNSIANGKWEHMMDMQPRGLPVYKKPEINLEEPDATPRDLAGISVENQLKSGAIGLPIFYEGSSANHFFEIYLKQPKTANWSIGEIPEWLNLNKMSGELTPSQASEKINVGINWRKWRQSGRPTTTTIEIEMASEIYSLPVEIHSYNAKAKSGNLFIEKNGVVSIYAENYSNKQDRQGLSWKKLPGLGYSNNLMQAQPFTQIPLDTVDLLSEAPFLEYAVITENTNAKAELVLNALPTHPITNQHAVRIGVQWNDNPVEIVNFQTYGRSEEWKQNVLRNLAKRKISLNIKSKGKHSLKIYMIDEGVALDFIYLNLTDQALPYSLLPETRLGIKK